ncbi:MAG: monovalent cation:proton antiporter-2 (CPA2) family protein [[Actinobacillus] rossii]|nr:monovalent cation:proton antiporter-2 (CPA2) family protein [[Actinobacillus] rossii]MDD7425845.1 monovalent cation:proton antiporter-2 (CPA2) family protein [[Actinobacillus] rossii]MDY3124765.1 monovalent cation:proton antiporter-2 (CPA2) family protein [[Actinobacillus] rossii]MDY4506052.1 monovalent cation:proton antiporter-2 (CPA2) family protein [[Actinobacillus] rossii]
MAAEGANQLVSVVTLLTAAVIAVPLFKRLGLGSVLGYLAAGLVIGPFGFAIFTDPEGIIHLAELGVVMFLFIIGLEMKPSHIWGLRNHIFCLGAFQIGLCTTALTGLAIVFGFDWRVAFVSASGFVLTSTAIVMQELNDRGDIATARGQSIVSILLFEDLLIVPLLAVVTFLSPNQVESSDPLWQKIALAGVSIAVLVGVGLWLLNPLFKILAKTKNREVMTAAALLVVLGSALLMEEGGLSMAMGAFVAGVLLSESSFRHQLEADVEPFRGLLLGLFFLGVGMSLNLTVVMENWGLIIAGVLSFMFVKGLCIYLVARVTRTSHANSIDRMIVMAQGGEFAFVLFAAAADKGVISGEVQANMTAIVVLSMVLTPIGIILHKKYIIPRLPKKQEKAADHIEEQHPTVLVGLGRFGQIINQMLVMTGHHPTIIDKDALLIANMKKRGVKSYYGDATRPELLHAAGVEHAELLIVAIDDKYQALHIVELARKMNPQIKIIARAYDRLSVFDLYNAGADIQVRETFDSALRTGKKALLSLGMDSEVVNEIAETYYDKDRHTIKLMAEVYDPKIAPFENAELIKIALEVDQELMVEVQQIINKKH